MGDWKELSLNNFHVVLLTLLFVGLLGFTLHMAHHSTDQSLISWGKESAATVLGGLMYAITGRGQANTGGGKQ